MATPAGISEQIQIIKAEAGTYGVLHQTTNQNSEGTNLNSSAVIPSSTGTNCGETKVGVDTNDSSFYTDPAMICMGKSLAQNCVAEQSIVRVGSGFVTSFNFDISGGSINSCKVTISAHVSPQLNPSIYRQCSIAAANGLSESGFLAQAQINPGALAQNLFNGVLDSTNAMWSVVAPDPTGCSGTFNPSSTNSQVSR